MAGWPGKVTQSARRSPRQPPTQRGAALGPRPSQGCGQGLSRRGLPEARVPARRSTPGPAAEPWARVLLSNAVAPADVWPETRTAAAATAPGSWMTES